MTQGEPVTLQQVPGQRPLGWAGSGQGCPHAELCVRPSVCVCVCLCVNRSVLSDSLQLQELQPARLLWPWDSPGKNTEVGCKALLQGIFPTQGSNPGLLHYRTEPVSLMSPAVTGDFFPTSPGKPILIV